MTSQHLFESVLLLEDDPGHAMLITRALRDFTVSVRHFERLGEALQAMHEAAPELVITDLQLPDSEGVRHIESIKSRCPDSPIIVLTSSTSLSDAIEAMKLGASDFIVKSFDADFREVFGLSLSRVFAAARLQEEKRKLQREMEVLRVAIENSNDGLAVSNLEGEVQYGNRSFRLFVRRCGGDEQNILNMFSPKVNGYQSVTDSLKSNVSALASGSVWTTEVTFADRERSDAFELSLSVIGSAKDGAKETGDVRCVVWVKDVSEMKRREKFQREILSTTSHDLKGPLGAISLSSELIQECVSNQERVKEIALRISSSAHAAINLIEEFLSARRIKEGAFILKPARHNVSELIEEVLANYESIAAAKRINLKRELDDVGEAVVDKLGFERVLGNLFSNAIKFTPKLGSVTLHAYRVNEDLCLEVRDTGSGMEPSEAQKIFERFQRLERHDHIGGSGIGLFVVKSIVTAHGGKIEVTSHPGRGTMFRITFPASPPVNAHGELIALDFV